MYSRIVDPTEERTIRRKKFVYLATVQSSAAVMRAGKHSCLSDLRMIVISEGVKGLLRTRRESLVVWAFKILLASDSKASGLGGSMGRSMGEGDAWYMVDSKRCKRAFNEAIVERSVVSASVLNELDIFDNSVGMHM